MEQRQYFKKTSQFPLPSLIEIQTSSYHWFFKEGLKELFSEISPIDDFTGKNLSLTFGDFYLEEPKYTAEEARERNLSYKAALKCKASLLNKQTKETKEQEVFLGEFPLMTKSGTFIINGIERVVVAQIVRSYGVLFVSEELGDRKLFGAKIIPNRGAWLELETSGKDVISIKVDRKRKVLISTLLRAFGYGTDNEIIDLFKKVNDDVDHDYIKATLEKDPAKSKEEGLIETYRRLRPGELVTAETAAAFLESMFFNPKRYDIGRVGRYKINQRLEKEVPDLLENRILLVDDLVDIVKEIIRLNNDPEGRSDDIDHLKNRRIRTVGELVQNKVRVGLLRMERIIRDRMAVSDLATVTPAMLINARPITAVLQEFFASSQLSQFMNQTNPLSELEHKRTLSATGPGGLSRERAGFEVRDVHQSHYGRICPIQTPEGPNIGLVGYLSTYAKINKYGFIETPYYKVEKEIENKPSDSVGRIPKEDIAIGRKKIVLAGGVITGEQANKIAKIKSLKIIKVKPFVTKKIEYLNAEKEDRSIAVPASAPIDEHNNFIESKTVVRKFGSPASESIDRVQYMDVSPKQIVSLSTALIPFLEHDEAGRASMGSNMQRQAVPLIKPERPTVGTGIEESVGKASGEVVLALEDGIVESVTGERIIIKHKKEEKIYPLIKFQRTNQGTCLSQKPVVEKGQKVKKDEILADSHSTDHGELALGQNILVAFMSFIGGNFEDAIIISERLVKKDIFTSVHIEEYTMDVRETKLGPEQITRDIPNVSEEALRSLDENGVVMIGAKVRAGDILVGKISPKGEVELSAEERLLRAIFGEKAKEVRDSSLRLPHGEHGVVVGVNVFEKGDELPAGVTKRIEISVAQLRKVTIGDKLAGRHGNKGVIAKILPEEDMPFLPDGRPVDIILNPLGVVARMNLGQIFETHLGLAAKTLGYDAAVPVFESPKWEEIQKELKKAGFSDDGKIQLYDGRTGEPFGQKTTVGFTYIMKLIHLVEDKIHARSIGPYSMITQQPLGGKAQFGGQRFGEMEVWALEAYGAAHTLQEMLTIKSDDVQGRSKAYESIIRGESIQKPSIPESFHVLVKELQSLGLSVELLNSEHDKPKSVEKEKSGKENKTRRDK
ncbi:MAG: DNA-directed RNA polymerase subunit beta [Candidatus Berkelbacteria bacterium]|nr:DNA-directed RNA polymerase subunit beta [Candidatus Berkelbacteria bacterium]